MPQIHRRHTHQNVVHALTTRRRRLVAALTAVVCVPLFALTLSAGNKPGDEFSPFVDSGGNISLPKNFETKFVHLGTIAVATDADQPVDQMHSTFTRREDVKSFQQNGKFADGAVLVKAVRGTVHEELTTGQTSYADNIKVWFVMVKDSKGRFKENDLWGDGWGWALFKGDNPGKQVATDYRSDCRGCHVPAQENDWVFKQCYPLLRKQTAAASAKSTD